MEPESSKQFQSLFRFVFVIFVVLLCMSRVSFAQLFWIEPFNTTCTGFSTICTTGYFNLNNPSPNGTWTETAIGVQGSKADVWFVSDAENGNAVGSCGTSSGGNGTLHIGNVPCGLCFPCPTGDCGAAYNAGGFGSNTQTNKRVESPLINCTGQSNITLSFKWIGKGQFAGGIFKDYCDVVYSSNGGTSWSVLQHGFSGISCPGGQGKWACFQTSLPASANNNSLVKIGFQWVNNNDAAGTDPSFAVDDISLSSNGTINASCSFVLPIELVSFRGVLVNKKVQLTWLTASEINNDYFQVERSPDALHYNSIGTVPGAGTSTNENKYSFSDDLPDRGTNYYRLRQVDYNGAFSFSNAIAIKVLNESTNTFTLFSNPCPRGKEATLAFTLLQAGDVHWMVEDPQGIIHSQGKVWLSEGFHSLLLPTGEMPAGCYILGFSVDDLPIKFCKLIVY